MTTWASLANRVRSVRAQRRRPPLRAKRLSVRSDQEGFDQYGFDQYGFDQHGFDQYGFDQMIEPGSRASRERQTEPVTGCHRPPPPLPLTNTSSPFSLSLPPSLSHTRSLALTLPVGTGPHRAAGRAVPPHHPLLPPQPLLPLPRQHPHRPHPQGAPCHPPVDVMYK